LPGVHAALLGSEEGLARSRRLSLGLAWPLIACFATLHHVRSGLRSDTERTFGSGVVTGVGTTFRSVPPKSSWRGKKLVIRARSSMDRALVFGTKGCRFDS